MEAFFFNRCDDGYSPASLIIHTIFEVLRFAFGKHHLHLLFVEQQANISYSFYSFFHLFYPVALSCTYFNFGAEIGNLTYILPFCCFGFCDKLYISVAVADVIDIIRAHFHSFLQFTNLCLGSLFQERCLQLPWVVTQGVDICTS